MFSPSRAARRAPLELHRLSFTVVYRMLFTLGIEFSPATPDTSPLQRILVEM